MYKNHIIIQIYYNNNTNIMDFTSTTELARKGSKAFQGINYATVLHNNKDIGMIVWGELYKKLLESEVLEDLLEDIEIEMNREKLQADWTRSANSWLSDLVI